jgi:hypothetical protein
MRMVGTKRQHKVSSMIRRKPSAIHELDDFFMGTAPLFSTVDRLAKTLASMNLPFAISGALAVNYYGHRRATQDVDILMRREDLATFKSEHLGRGWLEKFEGSKGFVDTIYRVPVDVLITGDYPGDGKPKAISFPDPGEPSVIEFDNELPYLTLAKVVELKLACGMSAPDRVQDFADVIALIRANELPVSFGASLDSYVHTTWQHYWQIAQVRHGEY